MTIDEAIEILTEDLKEDKYFLPQKFVDATELGIEALKRLGEMRLYNLEHSVAKLPGETEP